MGHWALWALLLIVTTSNLSVPQVFFSCGRSGSATTLLLTSSKFELDALREQYLTTMKRSVTGILLKTPSLIPRINGSEVRLERYPYSLPPRETGGDWPEFGVTMVSPQMDRRVEGRAKEGLGKSWGSRAIYLMWKYAGWPPSAGEYRGAHPGCGEARHTRRLCGMRVSFVAQECISHSHECTTILAMHTFQNMLPPSVWRGGASIFAKAVMTAHGIKNRKVHLVDSFQGLPPNTTRKCMGLAACCVGSNMIVGLDLVCSSCQS